MENSIDLDTQSRFFMPKKYEQASQPTINDNEMTFWRDTGTGDVFLVYRNATAGTVKVQLT